MRYLYFALLILSACSKAPKIQERFIYLGYHHWLYNIQKMPNGDYQMIISARPDTSKIWYDANTWVWKGKDYLLDFSVTGDSLKLTPLPKNPIKYQSNVPSTYIETSDGYYLLHTLMRKGRRDEHSKESLHKYDKNWQFLWAKDLDSSMYITCNTFMVNTSKNEFLVFSSEVENSDKYHVGVSIKRTDKNGKVLSKKVFHDLVIEPTTFKKDMDNNAIAVAGYPIRFMKFNSQGDTIWTRLCGKVANDFGWSNERLMVSSKNEYFLHGLTNTENKKGKKELPQAQILKYGENGDLKWRGKYDSLLIISNLLEMDNGNFIYTALKCEKDSEHCKKEYLIEINSMGKVLHKKQLRNTPRYAERPTLIKNKEGLLIVRIRGVENPKYEEENIISLLQVPYPLPKHDKYYIN